jgi:radical SAM protein with 4Fe4S-binding SPASM domain
MATMSNGNENRSSFRDALPINPNGLPTVQLDTAHSPLKVLAQPSLLRAFVHGEKIRPIHMRIGITGACNMRCSFCNFHSPNESQFYDRFSYKDSIPADKCVSLFEEFSREGGKAITFCGSGECTIHPAYAEIANAGHAMGLRIGLITNGAMLHTVRIADCVTNTHCWVRIGMNAGTPSTFAQVTRHSSGTFLRILNSIQRIRDAALDPDFRIGLNYVITKDNYTEILKAVLLASGTGGHYIRFEPEFYTSLGHATIGSVLEEISGALQEAMTLSRADFEVSVPKLDRGPMDQTSTVEGKFLHCHYSRFVTAVGADGNLYPCPQVHLNERYRIGSVLESGYTNVLDGGPRDDWEKSNPLRTDLCKTCFYRPQNELLELLRRGLIDIEAAIGRYQIEVPSTLHAEFI